MLEYPISYEWTIDENRLEALKDSVRNEYLRSNKITNVSGVKYRLRIHPNGNKDANRGKTLVFLDLELGEEKKVEAEFTLSIKSVKWSRKFDYVFEKNEGRGISCCTLDELFDPANKFIVNGKLTVNVEGVLKIENTASVFDYAETETKTKNKSKFLQTKWKTTKTFGDLWSNGQEDFTITVDGKEIKVHKPVLTWNSRFLAAMLNEESKTTMTIPVFSFEIVETAIKLFYEPKLVPEISVKEAISLFKFAKNYHIFILKENLEEYLSEKITVFNVCEIANCAILQNSETNVLISSPNVYQKKICTKYGVT